MPRGCLSDEEGRIVNRDHVDQILLKTTGECEARTEPGEGSVTPEVLIRPNATHPALLAIPESDWRYEQLLQTRGKVRLHTLGLDLASPGRGAHFRFVAPGAARPDSR
jgi:hypothetical protein